MNIEAITGGSSSGSGVQRLEAGGAGWLRLTGAEAEAEAEAGCWENWREARGAAARTRGA